MTIEAEEIAHSDTGASGASRWMKCPGSIPLAASLPRGEHGQSGIAAAEGTAAHALLAMCMETGDEPWEHAGEKITVKDWTPFDVNQDMVDAVATATDYLSVLMDTYPGDLYIEQPMQHPKHPSLFGTCDFALLSLPEKKLFICDYKHGRGVVVEPTSEQLKYYAKVFIADVLKALPLETLMGLEVVLTIMQPRIPHPEGRIRSYITNLKELTEWFQQELLPALKETQNPDAILVTGDHCIFCPVKNHCPAIKREVAEIEKALSVSPDAMTGDELGDSLSKIGLIEKFLDKLKEVAFQRANRGEKIKGFKLVRQKTNRTWKDTVVMDDGAEVRVTELMIAQFGKDSYQEAKLRTPPMMEKEVAGGKKFVKQYAFSPLGGLTLAKESDSRTEVKSLTDTFFDRLDETVEV